MNWEKFYNTTSKRELFLIAYNFSMLQADENERDAIEILENEKSLIRR